MNDDFDYNVVAKSVIVNKDETNFVIIPERPLKNLFVFFNCSSFEIGLKINDTDIIKPRAWVDGFDYSNTNLIVKKMGFILLKRSMDTTIYYEGINKGGD